MTISPPFTGLNLELAGTEARTLRAELDEAITFAERVASKWGTCGVLVTRLDYGRFTVAISPDVPYGITCEAQNWSSDNIEIPA